MYKYTVDDLLFAFTYCNMLPLCVIILISTHQVNIDLNLPETFSITKIILVIKYLTLTEYTIPVSLLV